MRKDRSYIQVGVIEAINSIQSLALFGISDNPKAKPNTLSVKFHHSDTTESTEITASNFGYLFPFRLTLEPCTLFARFFNSQESHRSVRSPRTRFREALLPI